MSDINYQATVVKIDSVYDLGGLDNLKGTNIFGNQVLIGNNVNVGDAGLYFPLESQLGDEFCVANDLLRRKDDEGNPAGGMFEKNRRVRAICLKGNPSMGFWIPVGSLDVLGVSAKIFPSTGDSFNELGKHEISKKYVVTKQRGDGSNRRGKERKSRVSKLVNNQFRFHFNTPQLGKNCHKLNKDDIISITWKFHGTSAIASRVLAKTIDVGWLKKSLVSLDICKYKIDYDYLYASRKVVKNDRNPFGNNHYYKRDLWSDVGKSYFDGKLHKGESIYYEIVGYSNGNSFIQKGYDYGCDVGTCKPYIYRITMTNVDGYVTELSCPQVKQRCAELNVEVLPEIYYGTVSGFCEGGGKALLHVLLQGYVNDVSCEKSAFCHNSVPEEGVVVRKEGLYIESYKLKSFLFQKRETKLLDKGEENIEDNQEVESEES